MAAARSLARRPAAREFRRARPQRYRAATFARLSRRPSAALAIGLDLTSTTDAAHFTPQWAKSAIWYQIFPERFANGDPANDPTAASLTGPSSGGDNWQVHSWTADW